jgi:hypothetical protein
MIPGYIIQDLFDFCYYTLGITGCGIDTLGFQPELCEDSQNDYAYDHDPDAD